MLLLIDTSADTASVILCADGVLIAAAENPVAREHSAWLHPAIKQLLAASGRALREIRAVAVLAGPGSYTGLRVGMAAAKGFCYALKVPLISINNLRQMAYAMKALSRNEEAWLCPMIDARRQEVFTALYNAELDLINPARALILDKMSFEAELAARTIIFAGSGAAKWQEICTAPSAVFIPQLGISQYFIELATVDFNASRWADTVYSEPEYGKEFHTHVEN